MPKKNGETANQHLIRRVPTAHPTDTVDAVLQQLLGKTFDSIDAVYILDEGGFLRGLVRLGDFFALPTGSPIGESMVRQFPMAYTEYDQERVAGLAVHSGLAAIPVVDRVGYFLGVVPAQALIAILRQEHIEDLHRLAGIQRENSQVRHAWEDPPTHRAWARLPWLLVGLGGSVVATLVMSQFEELLATQVMVSFFIPGIIYLADAIGTQTEAIAVRGLSLNHQSSLGHLLVGELRTGMLIGACLGGLSFPLVFLGFGDLRLAWAVTLAVFTAGTVATTVGLLFPWLLHKNGQDPAFGSGPVATIIQDVLSLVIYFVFIQWLVL